MRKTLIKIETEDLTEQPKPWYAFDDHFVTTIKPGSKISVLKKDNSQYILGINEDGDVEIQALGGRKISINLDSPSQIKIQTT